MERADLPKDSLIFPDNFIIDFAPVDDNWTVSLKEQKGATYENLKKWCSITTHVSYWYYTCVHAPYAIYERTQADLKAMREAGSSTRITENCWRSDFDGADWVAASNRARSVSPPGAVSRRAVAPAKGSHAGASPPG